MSTDDEYDGIDENSVDYDPVVVESVEEAAPTKWKKGKAKKDTALNRDFSHMFWGLAEEVYETGIHALDIILGGGYDKGDMIEISGDSGLGKTTLIMELCKRMYEQGMTIAYLDVENAIKSSFFKKLLINIDDVGSIAGKSKFFIASPQNFKELEDICTVLLREIENPYDILIIDSLSNVSQYSETLSIETKEMGMRARQESLFFSKFKSDFRKTKTTTFIINQMRVKMGKIGNTIVALPDDSTGGKSSKHNFDIRLRIRKGYALTRKEETLLGSKAKGKVTNDDETPYGCVSKLSAIKNRNERPDIPVNLHVIFGEGISNTMFLIDVLKRLDIIKSKGAGYWNVPPESECTVLAGSVGRGEAELEMMVEKRADKIIQFLKDINHWSLVIK